MKSVIKKIVSLILVLTVLSALYIPASANETDLLPPPELESQSAEIRPFWANIASVKPYISVSGGTASISAIVSVYTNSFSVTATIQKKNLLSWSDVKSFSKTFYSKTGTLSDSYYVGSGTFRLKVTVTAGSETTTVYS